MMKLGVLKGYWILTLTTAVAVGWLATGCSKADQKATKQTPAKNQEAASPDAAEKAERKPSEQPPSDKNPQPQASDTAPAESAPARLPVAKVPCPETPEKSSPEASLSEVLEQVQDKPRDLGPPLVDDVNRLIRLARDEPVWVDRQNKHVVLQGEVCRAGYPLEFFATYTNRAYEAVVSVNVKPSIVHAGLMAIGAKPGHPAQFQPEFVPPTGTEVAIEVRWKDDKGKVQSAPAQHWIRNIKTGKPLDSNWVFAGSAFIKDEATGKEYYQADSGELICVLSLPTAMLDLPMRSYGALEARSFEAFAEHLPPAETPITILLKPILSPKADAAPAKAEKTVPKNAPEMPPMKHAEIEARAIAAAEPWLALVDQGEYAQGWEAAASYLRSTVDRKDFLKSLTDVRKPLGKVLSRQLESKQYVTRLPKAPDGHYVLLQYKTSFENRRSAIETITPMMDKHKKWRVSGYYINVK